VGSEGFGGRLLLGLGAVGGLFAADCTRRFYLLLKSG
jgi:hypothetical protein